VTRVFRFDRAPIAERVRLPGTGGLRLTGELTRTGVFAYTDAAGKVVREYRPAEEVAKADSLATIEDVPVTIGHPPTHTVNGESFSRFAVGHARSPSESGGVVRGTLVATRKDAVKGLDEGKYVETSMGYTCRQDMTPGVTPSGEAYDAVQRDIVYNHVALLPAGQARLGTRLDSTDETVLRLDAAGHQIHTDEFPPADEPDADDDETKAKKAKAKAMKAKYGDSKMIKVDGKEYEPGSAEHLTALETFVAKESARADAATAEVTRRDEAQAKAARAALESAAVSVLGKDFVPAGQTDRQIKEAVIAKRGDSKLLSAERADAYVDALFDAAMAKGSSPKGPNQIVAAFVKTDANETNTKIAEIEATAAKAWERN
jgi:hypothetical protein